MKVSAEQGNVLSVRMELQADCFAGIWAKKSNVFEDGDIEEALSAANAIGDDRLQKKKQRLRGYQLIYPRQLGATGALVQGGFPGHRFGQCDTFATDQL